MLFVTPLLALVGFVLACVHQCLWIFFGVAAAGFLTLSTLLLVSLQLARYVTMVKIDVLRNVVPPSSRLWNSWKVLLTFFIEVALCIIHVPPMWNDYKAFTPEGSDNYYIPLGYVHETKLLPSDAGCVVVNCFYAVI